MTQATDPARPNASRLVAARVITGDPTGRPHRTADGVTDARRRRWSRYSVIATVVLASVPVALVLAVSLGAVPISPSEVWSVVAQHVLRIESDVAPVTDQIVWEVRTPRVLLAFVVGAGLAVAGAVLQAVVHNPLADPYVLGVSAGASAAAVTVLTVGGAAGGLALAGVTGRAAVSAAAFAGALLTLAAVVALGRRRGRLDPLRLLLVGVALSYLLQAVTSYLQLTSAPNQLASLLFWLLGTVSGADWGDLGLPTLVVLGCTGWLVLQGRGLNALLAGDDVAASLGIRVHRLRLQLLVASAALTAAVISVAGGVGFIGLVAPHVVRLLVGPEHRRLLPLTALVGGVFLVAADLVGRTLAAPLELPLTIVTAVAGVPFFLYLVRRDERPAAV